jgi:hypothetical protein
MAKTMSEAPEQGLAVDELIELLRDRARDHGGDKLLEAAAAEIDRLSDLARRVEGAARGRVIVPYGDSVEFALADDRTMEFVNARPMRNQLCALLPLDAGEGVDGG